MAAIVVFGTICLDRFCPVTRLPSGGKRAEAKAELIALGGEAANTALALKMWGADMLLYGNPTGNDSHGAMLRDMVNECGLPVPAVLNDYKTPVCDIFFTPSGERKLIGRGFSTMAECRIETPNLSSQGWFTADPNMPDIARKQVEDAQRRGQKTYLLDFIREADEELLKRCDVWQSSTDWAGRTGETDHNLAWCREHSARYGCLTILTDGEHGCCVCEPGGAPYVYPAFRCEKNLDATGAGDLFRAGMLFGLSDGWTLNRSLRFASAAACLNCSKLGATGGLASRKEIEEFISSREECFSSDE